MPRRQPPWIWIIPSVILLSLVALTGMGLIAMVVTGGSDSVGMKRIGVVEINGEITDKGSGSALSRTPGADDVIDDLNAARKDETIKAVVVRINSPGGSPTASKEIYRAIQRLKDTGKPVICSMGDLAASGGYYVAAGCDEIYANGATLTGSIGVISQFVSAQDVLKKIGITPQTIKSGPFKDAGNPTRNLTPQERQVFQQMIMDVYNQFVDDVAAGRKGKLTRNQILKLADGRVYTGRQAIANKLVDKEGGLQEAIDEAARRAGLEGEPKVKKYSGGSLASLFSAETDASLGAFANGVASSAGDAAGRAIFNSLRTQAKADAASNTPELR